MTITEFGTKISEIKETEKEFYIAPYVPTFIHPYDTSPLNFKEKCIDGTQTTESEYDEAMRELNSYLDGYKTMIWDFIEDKTETKAEMSFIIKIAYFTSLAFPILGMLYAAFSNNLPVVSVVVKIIPTEDNK